MRDANGLSSEAKLFQLQLRSLRHSDPVGSDAARLSKRDEDDDDVLEETMVVSRMASWFDLVYAEVTLGC